MNEILEVIFSGYTFWAMVAFVICGYFGFATNIYIDIFFRNPGSPDSPIVFDPSYWWKENKLRVFKSLPIIPIAIILASVGDNAFSFGVMNIVTAFFIGFGIDSVIVTMRNKGRIKSKNK